MLRELHAPFAPRAGRPQPQDRDAGVASCEVRCLFQAGQKLRERVNRGPSETQRHSGESEDPLVRFGQCPEIDARA